MCIVSFKWNKSGVIIETNAVNAFEMANILHSAPSIGRDSDGTEYLVTRAYCDNDHHFIRFEGGYTEPFLLAELIK